MQFLRFFQFFQFFFVFPISLENYKFFDLFIIWWILCNISSFLYLFRIIKFVCHFFINSSFVFNNNIYLFSSFNKSFFVKLSTRWSKLDGPFIALKFNDWAIYFNQYTPIRFAYDVWLTELVRRVSERKREKINAITVFVMRKIKNILIKCSLFTCKQFVYFLMLLTISCLLFWYLKIAYQFV